MSQQVGTNASAATVLWRNRWLLRTFVVREIQNRYAGSIGGFAWALVNPLFMLGIYAFVFELVFKVRFPELSNHPFIVFVALAMWPWVAFSDGLVRGSQAVVANAALIKKVAFAHELLVYAAVIASFAVALVGFVLVLLVLWLLGVDLHGKMTYWALVFLLLLMVFCAGLALVFSSVQAFARDFDQLLGQGLTIVFYITPVLYPIGMVPSAMQAWMQANPLVHLIEPVRQALLFGTAPDLQPLGLVAAGVWLTFTLGRRMFLRLSPFFEDVT